MVPQPSETRNASPGACRAPPTHAKELRGRRPGHQGRSWGGAEAAAGSPREASASAGGSGRASRWTPGSTGVFRLFRQRGLRGQRPPVSGEASQESPAARWGWSLPLDGSRGGGPKGPAEELGLITGAWGCGGLRGGVLHLRCLGRGHLGSQMEEDGAWGGAHSGPARRRGGTDVGHRWGPRGRAGGPTLSSVCSARWAQSPVTTSVPHAALSWVPWATVSSTSQDRTAKPCL